MITNSRFVYSRNFSNNSSAPDPEKSFTAVPVNRRVEAASRVISGEMTTGQAAREYGVTARTVSRWRQIMQKGGGFVETADAPIYDLAKVERRPLGEVTAQIAGISEALANGPLERIELSVMAAGYAPHSAAFLDGFRDGLDIREAENDLES